MEKKKRTRIVRYTPDKPDPDRAMQDDPLTPNYCTGEGYLQESKRQALEESKRIIEKNTIKPQKPQWRIWHKTGEKK